MTDEQWNEQWNLKNGARFNQLVSNYPIADDELLKMCKVLCEFVALTRVTDVDDYFFLDKDHTMPRLPFMLNSIDDIIKSKIIKGRVKFTDTIISPIFYMGNKKKLINKGLIDKFPDNISVFVDVFAGSSIVGMNVNADKHIVNDSDSNLVKLYELFKDNNATDIISHINSRIDEYGLARERTKRNEFKDKNKIEQYKSAYMKFRTDYNTNPNVLDFYTLMFYSFSQQFRFNNKGEFNMPCGNDCFTPKNEEYIRNGCTFFSKATTKIYNKDFRELLKVKNYPENVFFYFDPPYLGTTATYNENNGWNEQDESDLYAEIEKLSANNVKWAMSNVINNKGKVNQMLIDWIDSHNYNVHTFDGFTYTACGRGNSTHSFWIATLIIAK